MKKILTAAVALLLCLALAFLASCRLKISAEELSKDYERTVTGTAVLDKSFDRVMLDFSFGLLQNTLTEDADNDLCSPLSALLCLAMIANGTDGQTRADVEAAFGMPVEDINQNLYALTSGFYTADDCKIGIANSLWLRDIEALCVKESFLQTNADWYGAQVYRAAFDERTVKDINNWCNKYTDGMIKEIINTIPRDTVMYLINATMFDAKWENQYTNDNVTDGAFYSYGGGESDVKMLHSTEHTYLSDDDAQGFIKLYAGSRYGYLALLPNEGVDVYDYARALNSEGWGGLWEERDRTTVHVTMPEFSYETKMNLNAPMEAMGLGAMLAGDADYSALGTCDGTPLSLSEVNQKTFIQVDRNGTKAAAVTWGNMKATAADPMDDIYITLDRPFVYAIVDMNSGYPLFLGVVSHL